MKNLPSEDNTEFTLKEPSPPPGSQIHQRTSNSKIIPSCHFEVMRKYAIVIFSL